MNHALHPACEVRCPGRVAYGDALRLQEELVARRQRGEIDDTLLLLEHPRVLTLGRNTQAQNILLDSDALRARGFQTFEAGRGGDVTCHAPGQLVAYPILMLEGEERDAHNYLRQLEQVLIDTLADFGLQAQRHPPHTGVWAQHHDAPHKIAAIGVRLSRWVTSHGFALNVDCDLADFEVIVPCGISDYGVTSMAELMAQPPQLAELGERVQVHFGRVFNRRMTVGEEVN